MTAVHGNRAQLLLTSTPNVALTTQALTDPGDHQNFNSSAIPTKRYWDRTASWTVQAEYDEVQTIQVTGSPTGGTYTLTFGGQTTATINWNDPASTVQTRLQALSSITAGKCLVTGGPGPATPYTVEFVSTLGFASQALITLTTNSLTGGSSPSVSITRAQGGATWTTQVGNNVIQYVGGVVRFTNAFLGTQAGCRVTGAYLPYTAVGDILEWAPDVSRTCHETTSMTVTSSPVHWKTYLPGLAGGSIKINKFLADNTYANLFTISTDDTLILSMVQDATTGLPRLEAYGKLTKDGMKIPLKEIEMEDLDFIIDGQLVLTTS
ncbi:MAG TPA: hypothetical protein VF974_00960 [Patescibacteria group bacterium]